MRIGRIIGLATIGYSVYKAYQNYSRTGSVTRADTDTGSGSSSTRGRSMMPLRRRGAL